MKRRMICYVSMMFLTILLLAYGGRSEAQNSVEGTLTVNDETYELKHAYIYQQDDEVVVALTDNPVTQDNVPFDLADLAYEGKIHGVSFGLSKKQKKVKTDSVYHVVYHKIFLGRGALKDPGKLTINRFDEKTLEAVLSIDKPTVYELYAGSNKPTYQYHAAFKVALAAGEEGSSKPAEVTITGDDTPAGKSYASYYKAKLAGNVGEMKKWVAKSHVKDLDSEMGKMMVKMSMNTDPKTINIVSTDVSGDSAILTVKGKTGAQSSATGNVKMVLEDGEWKVDTDKWDLTK
jgi:hypothetical protein